jgi:hypothetical protein
MHLLPAVVLFPAPLSGEEAVLPPLRSGEEAVFPALLSEEAGFPVGTGGGNRGSQGLLLMVILTENCC